MIFPVVVIAWLQLSGIQCIVSSVSPAITDYISFQVYNGTTTNDWVTIPYAKVLTMVNLTSFNPNRKTMIHFPGWGERPQTSEGVAVLAQAFLRDTNFVAIDYSQLIKSDNELLYFCAVHNTTFIGKALTDFFNQYIDVYQNKSDVHIVSHSMGSQIVHLIAQNYKPKKLGRVTALDPAGPVYDLPGMSRLSQGDADFIDVIHTDMYLFGDFHNCGDIDFFPNNGRREQPSCIGATNPYCSHHTSWRYFAESASNPIGFPAKKCYRNVLCDISLKFCPCESSTVYMGYYVNQTARGTYYLKTNSAQPFGLGTDGLTFS